MSLFLTVRVIHVLLGVLWVGAGIFATFFLFPSLRETNAAGNALFTALMRRRLGPYMGATAGIAALSGIWLYWRFTGGFNVATMGTTSGIVFGIGGLAGIAATIIGGAVIGRSVRKMDELIAQGAPQPQVEAMLARAQSGARVVAILMFVTVIAMAAGHYV